MRHGIGYGGILVSVIVLAVLRPVTAQAVATGWQSAGYPVVEPVAQLEADSQLSASNSDCTPATVRLYGSGRSVDDCLIETAFGQAGDNGLLLDGNETAIPVVPPPPFYGLAGIPGQDLTMTYSSAPVIGTYLHFYRSVRYRLPVHPSAGKLVITSNPDLSLRSADGTLLPASLSALAFSPGGSWLVADMSGYGMVRVNLSSFEITPFAPSLKQPASYADQRAQLAISEDGSTVVVKPDNYDYFKVYDLTGCTAAAMPVPAGSVPCPARDYLDNIRQSIAGLASLYHIRFLSDDQIGFQAKSKLAGVTTQAAYVLTAPGASLAGIPYLALGDSFSSGEGGFSYIAGTDGPANHCHQAVRSWPKLIAPAGQTVACSGARTRDIVAASADYRGQVDNGARRADQLPAVLDDIFRRYVPGTVGQAEFVDRNRPQAVTMTIGGNDIGFSDIVASCVSPVSLPKACYASYEDQQELYRYVSALKPRLARTYQRVRRPGIRLYVVGYPQIIQANGSCGLNVHFETSEISFARGLVSQLNAVIASAARAAGARYVDVSQALDGHELCAPSPARLAVNGLTAGNDQGIGPLKFIGFESYHPNLLGQQLLADAVTRQTDGLTSVMPSAESAVPDPAPSIELNQRGLARSGRQLNNLSYQPGMQTGLLLPGESTRLVAPRNLKPSTSYNLNSDDQLVGHLTTDAAGTFSDEFMLSTALSPGRHVLHVLGPDWLDQPTDDFQPVYVAASADDYDGDGLANQQDGCPEQVSSKRDQDGDGIDDACDPVITIEPAGSALLVGSVIYLQR